MNRNVALTSLVLGALAIAVLAWWSVIRRGTAEVGFSVGTICSVDDGEGWYRYAKILAVDNSAVHLRLYKPRFKKRPIAVRDEELILGTYKDPDGFGIGHLPLSRKAFLAWQPVFIRQATVEASEFDGYREWKQSGGGVFGPP